MLWSWPIYFSYLLDPAFVCAAGTTLWVAVAAQAIGVLLGFAVAMAGLSDVMALRALAAVYVWLWRGTPPLVQLLLLYFGLSQLGLRMGVLEAGLIGLGCYSASFISEIIRSGIASIDKGQTEAARAMGCSRFSTLRWVVLPQAARMMLPPFGNEFASMMRTTSLLSVISFEELLRVTTVAINDTFRPLELYAVAACYYLALYSAWTLVQARLEVMASRGAALDRQAPRLLTDSS